MSSGLYNSTTNYGATDGCRTSGYLYFDPLVEINETPALFICFEVYLTIHSTLDKKESSSFEFYYVLTNTASVRMKNKIAFLSLIKSFHAVFIKSNMFTSENIDAAFYFI